MRRIESKLHSRAWIPTVYIRQPFNKFTVFGFIGVAFWDVRVKGIGIDENGEDVSFGAGVDYSFNGHWGFRGQYRRVKVDGYADIFISGVHYNF